MSLTIAYITSRREPKIEWFFDSLARQLDKRGINIIVIDHFANEPGRAKSIVEAAAHSFVTLPEPLPRMIVASPKGTIWQGPFRLTKEDWWAKSNALNTAIAHCRTDWISFVDDRSVLWRAWLDRVYVAMELGYAVCGSYEKYVDLDVKDGVVIGHGESLGNDTRTPGNYPFDTLYGGSYALPLEWCLAVNGHPEMCDSLGLEDSLFGTLLRNSGYPIRYDSDMRLIEDRTQGQINGALKRSDHGVSPNDCSHKLVEIMRDKTTSQNNYDLRELRERVLAGEPFPAPTDSPIHWFTGTNIAEWK